MVAEIPKLDSHGDGDISPDEQSIGNGSVLSEKYRIAGKGSASITSRLQQKYAPDYLDRKKEAKYDSPPDVMLKAAPSRVSSLGEKFMDDDSTLSEKQRLVERGSASIYHSKKSAGEDSKQEGAENRASLLDEKQRRAEQRCGVNSSDTVSSDLGPIPYTQSRPDSNALLPTPGASLVNLNGVEVANERGNEDMNEIRRQATE